jgi:hypothetical protein
LSSSKSPLCVFDGYFRSHQICQRRAVLHVYMY